MMTIEIIITVCLLLLFSYIFDITSSKTKIPSVIMLLILGFGVKQITLFFKLHVPDISILLHLFGTIGLVLIVLEGSLELELNNSKIRLIRKSFLVSLLQIFVIGITFSYIIYHISGHSFKEVFGNIIPLCIISSAIAIPSSLNLSGEDREFVIYESSLSDIIGVLLFNFIIFNEHIDKGAIGYFMLQLVLTIFISIVATLFLSFLLSKIKHHIKFGPIIILIILIYAISKIYHLPALIFILLLGLFLGNLSFVEENRYLKYLKLKKLMEEVQQFRDITAESSFLIRSLFFIVFGFLINLSEILNKETLPWSLGLMFLIIIIRITLLKLIGSKLVPIIFIAPRGLITILLFFAIPTSQTIPLINRSLIIQLIIFSGIFMMFGLMMSKNIDEGKINPPSNN